MAIASNRFLAGLKTWLAPGALSLNIFFIGKFLLQQSSYNDKVDQVIATQNRIDERLTNFMGYYEQTRSSQNKKDTEQDEKQKAFEKDLNRFYSEYLPYIKFDYRTK